MKGGRDKTWENGVAYGVGSKSSRTGRLGSVLVITSLLVMSASTAQADEMRARKTFRDCDQCPEMVVIPQGSFQMGDLSAMGDVSGMGYSDERPVHRLAIEYPFAVGKYKVLSFSDTDSDSLPVHRVTIAYPFAVGKYEVTFHEWDVCVAAGGCSHQPHDEGWGRGTRPVINVSWKDAQEYVQWLSRETGQPYRLLSEAEWEYVARAGTTTTYWWGDTAKQGYEHYRHEGCHRRVILDYCLTTVPVGSFQANAFGVFDMAGNVKEWVEDCWHGTYKGAPTDGKAWTGEDCLRSVIRGGSWFEFPEHETIRSAYRYWAFSDYILNHSPTRYSALGFRIALTLTP